MDTGNKVSTRLSKIARDLNVGISTIVEFLNKQGFKMTPDPNAKIDVDAQMLLEKQFRKDHDAKVEADMHRPGRLKRDTITIEDVHHGEQKIQVDDFEDDSVNITDNSLHHAKDIKHHEPQPKVAKPEITHTPLPEKPVIKVVGSVDLENLSSRPKPAEPVEKPVKEEKKAEQKPEIIVEKTAAPKAVSTPPVVSEPELKTDVSPKTENIGIAPEMISNVTQLEANINIIGKIDLASPKVSDKGKKGITLTKKKHIAPKSTDGKPSKPGREGKHREDPLEEIFPDLAEVPEEIFKHAREILSGPKVIGKIDLPAEGLKKGIGVRDEDRSLRKKKRKRVSKDAKERVPLNIEKKGDETKDKKEPGKEKSTIKKKSSLVVKKKLPLKKEVNEEDVQKQVKETLARLTTKSQKTRGSKHRRDKRLAYTEKMAEEGAQADIDRNIIKITEFVSVSELASMMDVNPTQVIATCMSLGLFVSINQRLDAETMSVVADEFGYKVEFISVEVQEAILEEKDAEEDLKPRPPIVTVMGHVDHGKTSLLDYIRKANVIAGEAGGITQHIGAYNVRLEDGRKITFLDTPGHEAFTAMRARGAQVTDIAIIIVAADDDVMPQTIEAINHASAAGVPIVFAINKVDKPTADPEKIKHQLANMNYMVESWGGKYQSHDISAKSGLGVAELLEKVLLEAEMLDLRSNPNKRANGSVIESTLDKGRGYVATILVQSGTLKVGDVLLAGPHFGHIKAMFNERNQRVESVGPAEPVLILGLNGAPQAGDKFNVMESEREARQIANKREQLQREQGLRTQKHITLDEIGRRIAIGNFQELNIIVKGDVDGSIEALSDSLIKLSTTEIQVNVIHKAVGQITESDIMLASASNAIIVGFQVRPSMSARKLAEKEEIDIRLYSIIYDAINEIKSAMEGMLAPEIKEEIKGTAEVLTAFKITKVGTIAGCIVRDGKIIRNSKVRLIRDGIVVFTGELESLKRFKDDVKEVAKGYECGLNIQNYNDVHEGDFIEAFEQVEVAKTL
ncbi:MAG: translation initiation factor IF-2 [Prolixibacteraceae bacterium]|nr:translation initiation factor IF-2 [Prolixibacteraceae bacterium]